MQRLTEGIPLHSPQDHRNILVARKNSEMVIPLTFWWTLQEALADIVPPGSHCLPVCVPNFIPPTMSPSPLSSALPLFFAASGISLYLVPATVSTQTSTKISAAMTGLFRAVWRSSNRARKVHWKLHRPPMSNCQLSCSTRGPTTQGKSLRAAA